MMQPQWIAVGRSTGILFGLSLLLACSNSDNEPQKRPAAQATVGAITPGSVLSSTRVMKGEAVRNAGGDVFHPSRTDDISDEQRRRVWKKHVENLERLRSEGRIGAVSAAAHVRFSWPLAYTTQPGESSYYNVTNFVDHQATSSIIEYYGGSRTYNGHRGTDIVIYPWPWLKMAKNSVAVRAAAGGTITVKEDGNFSSSCTMNNNPANVIAIRHSDDSVSLYYHLKKYTLTSKQEGANVSAYETLGYVGSSGSSTTPHLHFEVLDSTGKLIDPYAGPYNATTPDTWWTAQKPYYESTVLKLTTGRKAPNIPACPNVETPNNVRVFKPGEAVFYAAYYRDQLSSQKSLYKTIQPNGTVFNSWEHTSPYPFAPGAWWYWSYGLPIVPTSTILGTWKFQATYKNTIFTHNFEVCNAAPGSPSPTSPANGTVLGTRKANLKWSTASCTDTYTVTVRNGSSTGTIAYTSVPTELTYIQTSALSPGKTYYWNATATSSIGNNKGTSGWFKISSTAN